MRSGSQVSETPFAELSRASAIRIATAVTRPTMVSRIVPDCGPTADEHRTNVYVKPILPLGKRMGDDRGKIRGFLSRRSSRRRSSTWLNLEARY